nr:hypothetical protein Iba_chr08bCG4100 [Ipomoea batatas]GMD24694.1 hypothetical protein Iba_chr08cCG3040 [Ipomoea batatas]
MSRCSVGDAHGGRAFIYDFATYIGEPSTFSTFSVRKELEPQFPSAKHAIERKSSFLSSNHSLASITYRLQGSEVPVTMVPTAIASPRP